MHTHLDCTRPIHGTCDQTKGTSAGRKPVAQGRIRVAESRAVKDVLEVRAELKLDPFGNLRVLEETEVLRLVTRPPDIGQERRGRSQPQRKAIVG